MHTDDIKKIGGILTAFKKLSGVEFIWKNALGRAPNGLPKCHSLHENVFCKRIKRSKTLCRKCQENDCIQIRNLAIKKKLPFVNECHAGVLEVVFPIFSDDGDLEEFILAGPFKGKSLAKNESSNNLRYLDKETKKALIQLQKLVAIHIVDISSKHRRAEIECQVRNPKIQLAVEYIIKNFCKPISALNVADLICLSESRFIHLFKEQTGITFSDYLKLKRIEAAKDMLLDNGKKICEVAFECGYNDQAYFGKIFRETTGLTPGNYKKRHGRSFQP